VLPRQPLPARRSVRSTNICQPRIYRDFAGFDGVANLDAVASCPRTELHPLHPHDQHSRLQAGYLSTSFVKFVSLDDAFCSTSSIAPEEESDTAIMRAGRSVFGAFTGALAMVKGLPIQPFLWFHPMRDAG
jgi:argininosuccinate lyase